MDNLIITIGRKYGSGGRDIGKLLSKALDIPCYDKELLAIVADDSGYSKEILESYDERTMNSFYYFPAGIYNPSNLPLQHQLFIAQLNTIKEIAQKESCVFVGRCADYVLSDNPNCINVFINGDEKARIERAISEYGIPAKKARSKVRKTDKQRAAYYNFYTTKKWADIDSYHLTIDSKIGIYNTVELIKIYVEMAMENAKEE